MPIELLGEIDSLSIVSDEPGPDRRVSARQELDRLRAIVATLPAQCRQVFELRKFEGLSHREIAERMGLSEKTIENHLTRALARVTEALEAFTGIHRRFEIKGEPHGILVIDDYGHHPAEIRATIGAIRDSWKRPLTVIFQPHRYSRTQDLFDEFLTAFEGADRLILTEIYPAGEDAIPGVNSEALYQAIKRMGHTEVEFVPDKNQIPKMLAEKLNAGDIALTLGAGDVYKVGEALVETIG